MKPPFISAENPFPDVFLIEAVYRTYKPVLKGL
jgi:hypothetical protein